MDTTKRCEWCPEGERKKAEECFACGRTVCLDCKVSRDVCCKYEAWLQL